MRLKDERRSGAAQSVTILFEDEAIPALAGESLAAALAAAGHLVLRETASGAPRGVHCGMGACQDCLVQVDGLVSQRACMTKVRECMRITHAGEAAPFAPPASRFDRACDVLVVGAGPAGLSAAIAAAEAGARVILLDERAEAGGQYHKPLAPPHAGTREDAQFREGDALRARAAAAGVEHVAEALVWGAFAADEIAVVTPRAAGVFRPRRLILATGAHERPLPMPGWTLPGVMTTGAMQTLVRAQRVSPAPRVVIAGNGPLNFQLACELLAGGAEVAAVVEAASRPSDALAALRLFAASPALAAEGLRYLSTLRRAGVPILWGAHALACEGTTRFTALRIATPAGEQRIEAGAAALNAGFQSETGLARALGCAHAMQDGAPATVTERDGRTSLETVFAVGDGARIGGARIALARGRLAGIAAARDLGLAVPSDAPARRALARAERFQAALWRLFRPTPAPSRDWPDAMVLCRCEEVTAGAVRAAIGEGARSLASVKRATRAGMGRCQGRFCAGGVAALCGAEEEAAWSAPRAPLRPIPAAWLREETPPALAIFDAPPQHAWRTTAERAPPRREADVVVIGGGVVGLSVALFCAREGREVLLLDRGEAGLGASTANAGSLHVQLLAYDFDEAHPGPLAETLPMGPQAIALWREIAQEAGEGLGIRTEGGLILGADSRDEAWLAHKVAFESARGIETALIGREEIARLAPVLDGEFRLAAWCPQEGQMDPLRGTYALRRLAERAGACIADGVSVQALSREAGGFVVTTGAGEVRCGTLVNAAGAHAAQIGRMLGLALPVRGIVQQVVVTEAAPPLLRPLVAYARRHLSLKQGDGGHLLIGGGWPGDLGADGAARLRRRAIAGNLAVARRVLPALDTLHVTRAWASLNIHLDQGPVICATPGVPGMFQAVTSNGATLAPLVGRMVAEAACRGAALPRAFALA